MNARLKEFISRLILGVAIYLVIVVNVTYATIMGGATTGTITKPTTLKVVLVQFADVHWDSFYISSTNSWEKFDKWHHKSDFVDLLASRGSYFGRRSVDLDSVHGSFRDYFWAISRQTYDPTVTVLNNQDANGYPIWVTLSGNKTSYGFFSFISAARTSATAAGYDVTTSSAVRVCYIYAGRWCSGIGVATTVNGPEMAVPERDPGNRDPGEVQGAKLGHIGYFCHEFGHMMGSDHPHADLYYWCLMAGGHKNGDVHANRPAPMNPWLLYKAGWASPTTLNNDLADANLVYSTSPTTPSTYYVRLWSVSGTDERLLIENRQLTNTYDQSLPPAVVTPPKSGGILIWRIRGDGLDENQTQLILADNNPGTAFENKAEDVFRPDGTYPYHKIFDYSTPANLKLSDGTLSHFVIDDYYTNGNTINIDFKVNYLSSNSSIATAHNNSRKLVRDSSGKYHLVYETEGEIYYQYSTDGGSTWSGYKRLSTGNGNNKFPSISGTSSKQFVVWQRYNSSTSKYDIYFAKNLGSGWTTATITAFSNFSSANDPLPVDSYKSTNRIVVCIRGSSKLRYAYSDNEGGSWTASDLSFTTSSSNNPSLSMGPTTPASTIYLSYDDGSNVYYNTYSTNWGTAQNISSGCGTSNNRYSSVEVDGSSGKNFAWQGYSTPLEMNVIVHKRNSEAFQIFANGGEGGNRPSITGLISNKRAIVCTGDNSSDIFKISYNGSSWSYSLVANNGQHPGFSAGTTTAKYVWTSETASPYEIKMSTETLSKSSQMDNIAYHRAGVLQDTSNTSLLWLELGEIKLLTSKGETSLSQISVQDKDLKLTQADVFNYLDSEPFFISDESSSLVWYENFYGTGLQQLAQEGASQLTAKLQLIEVDSKEILGSLYESMLAVSETASRTKGLLSANVSAYMGKNVFLRVAVAGIKPQVAGMVAGVAEIYFLDEKGRAKQQPPQITTQATAVPESFALLPSYPNPFNPDTDIPYQLPEAAQVTLKIYNMLGQALRTLVAKEQAAGFYTVHWDGKDALGSNLASGIYIYRLEAGSFVASKKLMLIR